MVGFQASTGKTNVERGLAGTTPGGQQTLLLLVLTKLSWLAWPTSDFLSACRVCLRGRSVPGCPGNWSLWRLKINSPGSPAPFIFWQRGDDNGTQTGRGTSPRPLPRGAQPPNPLGRNPREDGIAGDCSWIRLPIEWGEEAPYQLSLGLLTPLLGCLLAGRGKTGYPTSVSC